MRFFNTEGPIRRDRHYHIPPLDRVNLDDLLGLVRDERYFVLHAPAADRQDVGAAGALRHLLNAGSDYRCVYVTVEAGQAARENVADAMRASFSTSWSRKSRRRWAATRWRTSGRVRWSGPGRWGRYGRRWPAGAGPTRSRWCC